MSNENEDLNQQDDGEDNSHSSHVRCVPLSLALLLFIAMVGFGAALACVSSSKQPARQEFGPCTASAALEKAQNEAAKAQAEYLTTSQKRVEDLQLRVMQSCVDKGNVPILMGGNVDCRTSK